MRTIKFRVWDGKYMDYDVWVNSSGAFGEPGRKYNTPNIEINKYPNNTIIMQFTGLSDKNGKEIYEDDIIEYIQHHFNTKMTLIKRKIVNWKYDRWNIYETNAGESDIKLIGNIHENPELL